MKEPKVGYINIYRRNYTSAYFPHLEFTPGEYVFDTWEEAIEHSYVNGLWRSYVTTIQIQFMVDDDARA